MSLDQHIAQRLRAVTGEGASICVALSGGLDSVVLLDLMARHARDLHRSVAAVHVHHGLSPNADAWCDACTEICAARDVPLDIERVQVERSAGAGLEAAAREARYAVYASRMEDFVALAHHREDQSETVLLQLLRGTGLKGVAAMPEVRPLADSRVQIMRPLLGISRADIRAYAEARGLRWIEDESNASLRQDRNFLRHEITPRLDSRFAGWRDATARFARHAAVADSLLDDLARIDGLPPSRGDDLIASPGLSIERRANLLRGFLALNGAVMPSEARLLEMARQLFDARGDAQVRLEHEGFVLLKFRNGIRLERAPVHEGPWQRAWNGEPEVQLAPGHGHVRFEPATGEGLAAAKLAIPGWQFASRAGGEHIRIDSSRPTRTLKNLLQEHDVPPWERDRLPLLFHGERLVWVPGIGIEADYACRPGEPGLRPTWVPEP